MEDPTQFDLNEAIDHWRKNLAASPAFQQDDLDELEAHLHDSIRLLKDIGLSSYEAFWLAKNRLGASDVLDGEFGKVNTEQVWLNRALWMVVGSLLIGVLSSLASILHTFATLGVHQLRMDEALLGPFGFIVHVLAFVGSFLLAWRWGRQRNGLISQVGRWMRSHRVAAPIAVFLLMALIHATRAGATMLEFKTMGGSTYLAVAQWNLPSALLYLILGPLVLGWLLWRTTRKTVPRSAGTRR